MTGHAEWHGPVGSVWASEWRRTDRSFAGLSRDLDAAIRDAAPPNHGRAFDIGCGAGVTSLALATARPDLDVVGVDISDELVEIARARSEGITNASFVVADLNRELPKSPPPDLLFSRHGVMFFDDPVAVFARLRAAARPGARLVFSCFRDPMLNPWAGGLVATITDTPVPVATGYAPGPFAFADPAFVTAMLATAGWRDVASEPVDYRYVAGEGDDPLADAVGFFRRVGPVAAALRAAPDEARAGLLDRLAETLQKHRDHNEIAFPAAAWIWRAHA